MVQGSEDRRGFLKRFLAAVAVLISPFTGRSQVRRPLPRTNAQIEDERLVRDFFNQVFNQGNTTVLGAHPVAMQKCADEFHLALARQTPGKPTPDFREVVANFRHAMPDLHFDVQSVTPEGTDLFVRWRATGTHSGELYGFKGTGRKVAIDGTSRVTVSQGKITRTLQTYSASSLRQQLGAGSRA